MDRQKHREFIDRLNGCRKPLLNYIRYILWNKEQLEDAFQNTALEGWKKFAAFSGDEKWFRVWMFHIANYVVRNLNRAHKKTKELKDSSGAGEKTVAPEMTLSVDSLVEVLDTMEDKVKESVVALPDNERQVFLLRSVGEFSYEEIGKILDMPIGSVMGYLARARTKLKEKLYEYARELKYV
ncbi:MAG: sigma-70 family RNA polymerase sigma factor [Planctomycetes bacterium]|nr:sigma-70 family RNA polymerase sigma factor [Planctomycetota bacterium]